GDRRAEFRTVSEVPPRPYFRLLFAYLIFTEMSRGVNWYKAIRTHANLTCILQVTPIIYGKCLGRRSQKGGLAAR
ncbi:MAG: hypothetical protein WB579_17535, partial [Bryobacteraceae bacterium]